MGLIKFVWMSMITTLNIRMTVPHLARKLQTPAIRTQIAGRALVLWTSITSRTLVCAVVKDY